VVVDTEGVADGTVTVMTVVADLIKILLGEIPHVTSADVPATCNVIALKEVVVVETATTRNATIAARLDTFHVIVPRIVQEEVEVEDLRLLATAVVRLDISPGTARRRRIKLH